MKCIELYQLINNPAKLSEKTLPDLKQIVYDFPFFQAARILYLKNLAVVEDLRLGMEIKKMAIHIPDRMKLFLLIEGEQFKKQQKTVESEKSFDIVDHYLSVESDKKSMDESLIFEPTSSVDYMHWLTSDSQYADDSQAKFQHQDLIDSFIEKKFDRSHRRQTVDFEKTDHDFAPTMDVFGKSEKSLDSSYFTETLAHVYIKQKRYERALEIIRSLSLKYPEKNVYFADQIRFLEKLIIHSKK